MPVERTKFGVNTYSYTLSMAADACIDRLADAGFTTLELMLYPGHLWPGDDRVTPDAVRRTAARRGVRIVSLNTPNLDVNIGAADAVVRERSIGLLSDFVRLGADLEAEAVIVGPGKPNTLLPLPDAVLEERFHAALDRLLPIAAKAGPALWIENMPFAFLPDAGRLMASIERFGADEIKVCYDVANAHFIGEDPRAGLERVRSRLALVHVSDTGRDAFRHDPVGRGTVDFARLPSALASVRMAHPPVLEVISREPDRDIADSAARLAGLGW